MTYAVIVTTRGTGIRVYGPYDAETSIRKYDYWKAAVQEKAAAGYENPMNKRPEDPETVALGTFAEDPEEAKRS